MQKVFSIFLILVLVSSFTPLSQYSSFATHPETGTGEIHGIKWSDADGDGIFDQQNELILSGVLINITNSDKSITHVTTTATDGSYNFTGLVPDTYTVTEKPLPFSIQTYPANAQPHSIIISNLGLIVNDINFGNKIVGPSEIHGTIFRDVTNIGTFDAGDTRLPNVSVIAEKFTSTSTIPQFVAFTQTNVNGDYNFINLNPGIYKIRAFAPFFPAVQTVPTNNQPLIVTLSGQVASNVNMGFNADFGTITGITFIDSNENGIRDIGELIARFNQICVSPGTTCTSSNNAGIYTLKLPPGTYDVFAGPFANTGTSTFTTINIPSLVNGQIISDIDIPYRNLIPLPGDMDIPNSNGVINGVPTLVIHQPLSMIKNISACIPVESPLVTLTLSSGTILTQTMQNIPTTSLWSADFGVISGESTANIRVDIDCPPAGSDPQDVVQIGNLIFYDPSGQVINQCTNEPINDAITTLKVAAPQGTTNFVIPQTSGHLPSTNPQITDVDGNYGWVTIPGDYTVTATKTGFAPNTSPVVTIPPPVTGLDIFLTPVDGCPDTEPPTLTVTLEPIHSEIDEGVFRVVITATDAVDPNPAISANINGIAVSNGQLVKLEIDDEAESQFKEAKAKQCAKDQENADKRTAKGKPIQSSLQAKLLICAAGGVLQIEDASFTLSATATDASGNSASASAIPTFTPDDD